MNKCITSMIVLSVPMALGATAREAASIRHAEEARFELLGEDSVSSIEFDATWQSLRRILPSAEPIEVNRSMSLWPIHRESEDLWAIDAACLDYAGLDPGDGDPASLPTEASLALVWDPVGGTVSFESTSWPAGGGESVTVRVAEEQWPVEWNIDRSEIPPRRSYVYLAAPVEGGTAVERRRIGRGTALIEQSGHITLAPDGCVKTGLETSRRAKLVVARDPSGRIWHWFQNE